MFELISDVPAPVAVFYTTETTSEPTGNMIDEVYTYLDENEIEQTGTRPVPEYADVTRVIQVPFGEVKSWASVERVVSLGKPQAVIKKFVECAINGDKKAFHDAYIAWLVDEPDIDDLQFYDTNEDDSQTFNEPRFDQAVLDWENAEPVYTPTDARKYLMQAAKGERDSGRYAPITVDGLTYDATQEAYDNLQGMVNSWEIMIADQTLIDAGMVSGDQMYWTLADNSSAPVTKAMLEKVVTAIRVRAGLLHAQYQADKAAMEA